MSFAAITLCVASERVFVVVVVVVYFVIDSVRKLLDAPSYIPQTLEGRKAISTCMYIKRSTLKKYLKCGILSASNNVIQHIMDSDISIFKNANAFLLYCASFASTNE
jgi:hypothetical protein